MLRDTNQPQEISWLRRKAAVTVDHILGPVLLWMAGQSNKRRFEPGERALAVDAERDKNGRSWLATNKAVYIEEVASPQNRRRGTGYGVRIVYPKIARLREDRDGRIINRTLELRVPPGAEISGQFLEGRQTKLTAVIQSHLRSAEGPD